MILYSFQCLFDFRLKYTKSEETRSKETPTLGKQKELVKFEHNCYVVAGKKRILFWKPRINMNETDVQRFKCSTTTVRLASLVGEYR
jgi:hypothetical protein